MLEFTEHYIRDIASIKSGKRLPKGHLLTDVCTPFPYIKARDIRNGKVNETQLQFLLPETQRSIKKYIVKEGDICITIVANIGDVGIVPKGLNNANLTENAIRLTNFNSELVYSKYLCQVLSAPFFKEYMELLSAGAAQAKLGIYKIEKIKVQLPPLEDQKTISATLAAFEDLIEINNLLINRLEEVSSNLYNEWFVRMRFPGHRNAKFIKGIPTEWQSKSISKVVDFHIGGGWGNDIETKEFSETGFVIRGTDIPKIRFGQVNREVFRYHKASNIKSRELLEGDIIFETAGGSEGQPLGRTCYITQEILDAYGDKVIAASFCKQIRTTGIPSMYLYFFLNYLWATGMIETYQVQSTGISNFQFEPFLKFQQIILPDQDLMQKFHDIVLPMHKQIATLGTQNTKLREIRDRLLPRLISGKLQVKSSEIESVEPSSTKEANLA
jgi:type I restriction enzyme S subunit